MEKHFPTTIAVRSSGASGQGHGFALTYNKGLSGSAKEAVQKQLNQAVATPEIPVCSVSDGTGSGGCCRPSCAPPPLGDTWGFELQAKSGRMAGSDWWKLGKDDDQLKIARGRVLSIWTALICGTLRSRSRRLRRLGSTHSVGSPSILRVHTMLR